MTRLEILYVAAGDAFKEALDAGDTQRAVRLKRIAKAIDRELDGTAHHPNCECSSCYDKMDEDKRQDVLRSFDEMRNEMQPVWDAGDTPDMFGHNSVQADDVLVDYSEPGNQRDDADDPDFEDIDPGEDDPETEEFNAALDDVTDETGSVVAFGTTRRA